MYISIFLVLKKQILSYKYILGNEILDHFMDGYFIFLML